jgi:hypothetical protein
MQRIIPETNPGCRLLHREPFFDDKQLVHNPRETPTSIKHPHHRTTIGQIISKI